LNIESGKSSFEEILSPINAFELQVNDHLSYGAKLSVSLVVGCENPVSNAVVRILLYNPAQIVIAEWNSRWVGRRIDLAKGINEISLHLGPMHLKTGLYRLGVVVTDSGGTGPLLWSYKKHKIDFKGYTQNGPDLSLCDDNSFNLKQITDIL